MWNNGDDSYRAYCLTCGWRFVGDSDPSESLVAVYEHCCATGHDAVSYPPEGPMPHPE